MKSNLIYISLNILGVFAFFLLAILKQDVILSQLFLSISLIMSLNTIRLVSGKNLNINHKHEEKTGI